MARRAPFIDLGVVRILTGGAEEGGYLVRHPKVAHVHMTGGAPTHDAIVWGPGEEGARRKAEGTPLLDKPITSELGGVSPTIVVPGDWSAADLKFQAEHLATQRLLTQAVLGKGVRSTDPGVREALDAALANVKEQVGLD